MIEFLTLQVVLGIAVLGVFAFGLFGLVEGKRDHDLSMAFTGVFIMLTAVGLGCGIYWVASGYQEIVPTRVDRGHAVNCTADILRARDAHSRNNGDSVYRFHVRVNVPGKPPYETDTTAAVSPLQRLNDWGLIMVCGVSA